MVGASGWDTLVLENGKAKSVPIYAIFKDAYYLRYMNEDVHGNVFVLKPNPYGRTRTMRGEPSRSNPEVFISDNSSQIVTEWIDVATGDVYDKQTDTTITLNQHIDLYPKIEGQYWLVFNANAGGPGAALPIRLRSSCAAREPRLPSRRPLSEKATRSKAGTPTRRDGRNRFPLAQP